ncbi:hypothetical protein ASG71_15805 [Arthrobacter sp. Soil763]|nr:hypothetical protein ASG71_15805 [Arthrobacter sp. Soil763]
MGPTKMGKTVLVGQVVQDKLWLEGQWLGDIDAFWTKLAVQLNIPSTKTSSKSKSDVAKWSIKAKIDVGAASLASDIGGDHGKTLLDGWSVDIPQDQAVVRALQDLKTAGRTHSIVIDDFHFVAPSVRTEIIRALKPLVFAGIPAILITLPHRKRDSFTGVEDIGGRTRTISVEAWSDQELKQIAHKGFEALNLKDAGDAIADRLSQESYGSPELMQRFCLELCEEVNEVLETERWTVPLASPTGDWASFFTTITDEQATAWLEKIARGPKSRGKARNVLPLHDGRQLDGYQILLAAMKSLGPRLSMTVDDLKQEVVALLAPGTDIRKVQITTKLIHMSGIAATSLQDAPPEVDEDEEVIVAAEAEEDPSAGSVQPVFEYAPNEVPETVNIVEPFLAFTLRWHGDKYLQTKA